MNNDTAVSAVSARNWRGFAASVPGVGHIRRGIPCQDASLVVVSPRPALIVCDGRGSAALSHLGAQGAVAAFKRQIAIMEPLLANLLDREKTSPEQWSKFCRLLYRTLHQVQIDLGTERELAPKEFDFTVALAVVGTSHIGCFQVGDGSIVLRQHGKCVTAFAPEKGEFANQTNFLRDGGENRQAFQSALFPAAENSGIAVTSDGPEHMMFHLADMKPGRVFDCFFDDLAGGEFRWEDLMDYLTEREWNNDPRGADDRSVALVVPEPGAPAVSEPAAEEIPAGKDDAEEGVTDDSPVVPAAPDADGADDPAQEMSSPEEEEAPETEPDAELAPTAVKFPVTSALTAALALLACSAAACGWHQHSRYVATSKRVAVLEAEVREARLAGEAEASRLNGELIRIKKDFFRQTAKLRALENERNKILRDGQAVQSAAAGTENKKNRTEKATDPSLQMMSPEKKHSHRETLP